MKKSIKSSFYLALLAILVNISCSNDDETAQTMQTVIVNIEDFTITIDENPTNGAVLGTMETDGNGNLGFSITTENPAGALGIDEATGELSVADASLFDFETNPIITATVTADNAEDSASITVNLNNVNEVTAQALEVTIDENPSNGDVIGSLQTMGNASGFAINSQSPAGAMAIDANSGEITVADASLFDFETNPTLTATISIEDAENPVNVTVTLENVVEVTAQDFTVTVDENPTDGQVLGTVQANGNGTLDFSFTSQTPAGAMSINASTGELTVIDPNLFDFETNPVITAEISVTDGAETTFLTATINLNDVDEVSAQNTDMNIDENPSNGDVIGTLQASGSNLTYTITFQNPAGAFAIDQGTGELSVADETLFDFETNPNMLATISVSNGTQTVSANAFVALDDVNEIGEFKFGGVIFWIDPTSNSSAGLVCAVSDQSSGIQWYNGSNGNTGATGTAIGTGQANTTAIVNFQGTGAYAAQLCNDLSLNGYDDWFLPSRGELEEMYNNKLVINATATANSGTDFEEAGGENYWSSTRATNSSAFILRFTDGFISEGFKANSQYSVRAVRSWTDF